jgi:hypothetical protein
MFRNRFVLGFLVLFLAGGLYVATQGRGTGPKPTPTTTAPKAPAAGPRTPTKTPPAKATQPPMKTQHPSASPASTNTASKPATTKTASAPPPKPSPTRTEKTEKTPIKATAKTATGTTTTAELTPVQQKLKQNTNLAAKVASRLPQGTDLMAAAAGFKNLGQFVAAANVSSNLHISFTELKDKMMSGMSLGQAIQAVRPLTASPTVEAQRAEYDARGMIAETEQSTMASPSTVPSGMPTSTTAKPKGKTKSAAQ